MSEDKKSNTIESEVLSYRSNLQQNNNNNNNTQLVTGHMAHVNKKYEEVESQMRTRMTVGDSMTCYTKMF